MPTVLIRRRVTCLTLTALFSVLLGTTSAAGGNAVAPATPETVAAAHAARSYTLNQAVSKLRSRDLRCTKPSGFGSQNGDIPSRQSECIASNGVPVVIEEFASVKARKERVRFISGDLVFYTGRILGRVEDVVPHRGITQQKADAAVRQMARILGLPTRVTPP